MNMLDKALKDSYDVIKLSNQKFLAPNRCVNLYITITEILIKIDTISRTFGISRSKVCLL